MRPAFYTKNEALKAIQPKIGNLLWLEKKSYPAS